MAHQLNLNTEALEELKAKAAALPASLDPTIVQDIATAISNKGVTVPDGTKLDSMAALIESIEAGGGEPQIITGSVSVNTDSFSVSGLPITPVGALFKRTSSCYISGSGLKKAHSVYKFTADTVFLYLWMSKSTSSSIISSENRGYNIVFDSDSVNVDYANNTSYPSMSGSTYNYYIVGY